MASEHWTYVQTISSGGFFAVCMTCGPDPFPDRETQEEAEADARAHGELRAFPRLDSSVPVTMSATMWSGPYPVIRR